MEKYNESIENYVANRDSIVVNSISIDAGPYTMSNSILELDPLIWELESGPVVLGMVEAIKWVIECGHWSRISSVYLEGSSCISNGPSDRTAPYSIWGFNILDTYFNRHLITGQHHQTGNYGPLMEHLHEWWCILPANMEHIPLLTEPIPGVDIPLLTELGGNIVLGANIPLVAGVLGPSVPGHLDCLNWILQHSMPLTSGEWRSCLFFVDPIGSEHISGQISPPDSCDESYASIDNSSIDEFLDGD